MPQCAGLAGISLGGEQLDGFCRSKKNDFFPHNNQPSAGLIAWPAAIPAPNRTMNFHQNTMGDALARRFGWNQPIGRAIGCVPPKQKKRFFFTQQPPTRWADGIACGHAITKPNNQTSFNRHGRSPHVFVFSEIRGGGRANGWVLRLEK